MKCKTVVEIADLWPESLIAYDIVGKHNPIIFYLRNIEKWIYKHADKVVFTMEGAYEYIKERHWEKVLPIEKVEYINNGVDLELFNENKVRFRLSDNDLEDKNYFKAIYVGAIRKANDVGQILEIANKTKDKNIKYIIYGDGPELPALTQKANGQQLDNVVFKGGVEKKYIPYILSCADVSLFIVKETKITRFGISPNKMFDYFAAGKPLIISNCHNYNPALTYKAGVIPKDNESLLDVLLDFYSMDKERYSAYCDNALEAAHKYDFKYLTERLLKLLANEQ